MKRHHVGTLLIILGFGFLCAGVLFLRHNLQVQTQAGYVAQEVITALDIPTAEHVNPPEAVMPEAFVSQEDLPVTVLPESPQPDYILNPQMPMPEKKVEGISYVGVISIPALELELPVISSTTPANLQIAPCRYTGSAYLDDLVIGAHNYSTHFGRIKDLSYGDCITFTDMDGNIFAYTIVDMETLKPYQVEDLCDGKWPLSLYTCTLGGRTRVTIRCEKAVVYE